MKILISGIAGFVGSTLARELSLTHEVFGFDSFVRPGSEINRQGLRGSGICVLHADARITSDVEALPSCDWVIDAAANPSVLAGVDGATSSRQLLEHNLNGTVNLLEYCKTRRAGFTLLSTSRVYSIPPLTNLRMQVADDAFFPDPVQSFPHGVSSSGVAESFSTAAPVSLYGSTKVASECLALEYGQTFDFPVWVNRCGVLAGAGQFGKADQGIFSYWIHAWKSGRPLRYIGFGGSGHQVRDCLHPRDLVPVLNNQFSADRPLPSTVHRIVNLAGGIRNSMSLAQLSAWCRDRFGPSKSEFHLSNSQPEEKRPFDIPWMVLDSSLAETKWGWKPQVGIQAVLKEIATHAETNPNWLELV